MSFAFPCAFLDGFAYAFPMHVLVDFCVDLHRHILCISLHTSTWRCVCISYAFPYAPLSMDLYIYAFKTRGEMHEEVYRKMHMQTMETCIRECIGHAYANP